MEKLEKKYCSKCGTIIENNSNYCPICGKEFANNSLQPEETKNKTKDKIQKNSSFSSVLFAFIVMILFFAFIYTKLSTSFNRLFISKNSYIIENNTEITKDIYNISDEIFGSKEILTVNSISYTHNKGDFIKSDSGKKYAVINITVKNISDSDRTIYLSSFKLINSNGEKISPLAAINDRDISHHTLVSNGYVTGDIYFQIDESEHNLKLSYSSGIFNEEFNAIVDVSK